ncbi:MAG: type II toxin-antitoxin system VapC family toxin [Acidobacteriota bacterium]
MRLLLDTQCWLWAHLSPGRLSPASRELIENPEVDLFVSVASSWEIAIKHARGKLRLPVPPELFVPSRLAALGASSLSIEHSHALLAGSLPPHHADPFDRMLIAQAKLEDLLLLTSDRQFESYGIDIVWA